MVIRLAAAAKLAGDPAAPAACSSARGEDKRQQKGRRAGPPKFERTVAGATTRSALPRFLPAALCVRQSSLPSLPPPLPPLGPWLSGLGRRRLHIFE